MFKVPELYRVRTGPLASDSRHGRNGAFLIPLPSANGGIVRVLVSDGEGWEHASASLPDRCPTWDEMCQVKNWFWDREDCVVQYHPPQSAYVNCHPFCLHLWRPVGITLPQPPSWMVGPS